MSQEEKYIEKEIGKNKAHRLERIRRLQMDDLCGLFS